MEGREGSWLLRFPRPVQEHEERLRIPGERVDLPPPAQVERKPQSPHARTLPQPSDTCPQVAFLARQVVGTHVPVPHTLAIPRPPQLEGSVQVPQSWVPPQPSAASPQSSPRS